VGLDAEELQARIGDAIVKQRLREYTDAAYAAGVHGVPTLRIGDRLFWGDDQPEIAAAVH